MDKYYFWIRIFDYNYNNDQKEKGTLIDEYYLILKNNDRNVLKQKVINKSKITKFSKPKRENGKYALILNSNEYWHNWFYEEIDTICVYCQQSLKGKARYFAKNIIRDDNFNEIRTEYYCNYEHKAKKQDILKFEGEFQNKEKVDNIIGFIYHIFNKTTNKHYIGQTRFLPFFRWQEHVKSGDKGNIEDLIFETLTKVSGNYDLDENKKRLNYFEQLWINKFILEYGKTNIFNIQINYNFDKKITDELFK